RTAVRRHASCSSRQFVNSCTTRGTTAGGVREFHRSLTGLPAARMASSRLFTLSPLHGRPCRPRYFSPRTSTRRRQRSTNTHAVAGVPTPRDAKEPKPAHCAERKPHATRKEGVACYGRLGERARHGRRARSRHGRLHGGPQDAHSTQRPTHADANPERRPAPTPLRNADPRRRHSGTPTTPTPTHADVNQV